MFYPSFNQITKLLIHKLRTATNLLKNLLTLVDMAGKNEVMNKIATGKVI